jgi:hypothetical protein
VQGSIAQAAALTIAGNGIFNGDAWDEFWPNAAAFKFCKNVTFASPGRPPIPLATDPNQWIAALRSDGVVGFRLSYVARHDQGVNDHISVAFVGGGGRWPIEAVRSSASDLWESSWRVQDQNEPQRRIWGVTYYRTQVAQKPLPANPRDLAVVRRELEGVLLELEAFAARRRLEFWATCFRRGIDRLHSDSVPEGGSFYDMPRSWLPAEAWRILDAAQAGWVFGGMGSWNDIGFEEEALNAEYRALSERLYSTLCNGVCEATNSGFPSR